jgi:chemotaxis response regulator CheB
MPEIPEQTSPPAERYDPATSDETTANACDGAKKRRDPNEPTAVVGLGASAGGIQALQEFFGQMSAQSSLAFVVVMHLSAGARKQPGRDSPDADGDAGPAGE